MSTDCDETSERSPERTDPAAQAARHRAVTWLGRREYSVFELTTRLEKSGYDAEAVSEAIGWLRENDLVSDKRFAEALIRGRVAKGFGPLWIRVRLRNKRVPDDDIQQALEQAEIDWDRIAQTACEKRFGTAPCQDLKEKSRRYRFLAQRGFAHAQIDYALETSD